MSVISVVVPVYNQERFLEKCIDSLLGQTYTELEIILVDDGSTDKSGAICDVYAKKDARIKVIHKVNGGLSDARNAGIDIASGDYIAFVDSDDYVAPQMYERMYGALVENQADMVVCNCSFVDGDNRLIENRECQFKDCICTNAEMLNGRVATGENYFLTVVAWNKLMPREVFSDLRYPKGKYHEDEFVFHKMYGGVKKIACISDKLYCYRQVSGTITDSKNVLYRLDRTEAMYERIKYCLANGYLGNLLFYERTMYYPLEAVAIHRPQKDKTTKGRIRELKKRHKEIVKLLHKTGTVKLSFVLDRYMFWYMPKTRNLWQRMRNHMGNNTHRKSF